MLVTWLVFLILLSLGLPIAFVIGISGLSFFIVSAGLPQIIAVQKVVTGGSSFPLLAVPFFIFAGHIMNESGITPRLIRFATVLTGHLAGGLGQSSLALSAMMGGVSGSCVADAAMEARILGPELLKRGYSHGFTAALISLGSLITPTIPPSIGLILYGVTAEVSIGRLFMAGIVPGILMMIALMIPAHFIAKRRGYVREREKAASFSEIVKSSLTNIWALLFPLFLIFGIRFGIFTPTEAGAFAILYAGIVGKFIYKELTFTKLVRAVNNSVYDTGVVVIILLFSFILGYAMTYARLPQNLTLYFVSLTQNPYLLIGIILVFCVVAGMFMEAVVNTLLLTPIFLPIILQIGIDPVHFGVLFMTIVTLGAMTPPVGVVMYSTCSLLDTKTQDYLKEAWPFFIAIIILVALLMMFPSIVLFIPNLVYGL